MEAKQTRSTSKLQFEQEQSKQERPRTYNEVQRTTP